jgi:hypothetical protein
MVVSGVGVAMGTDGPHEQKDQDNQQQFFHNEYMFVTNSIK